MKTQKAAHMIFIKKKLQTLPKEQRQQLFGTTKYYDGIILLKGIRIEQPILAKSYCRNPLLQANS